MNYKVLNTNETVRESIHRIMYRQKIKKIDLAEKMGLSYPSILNNGKLPINLLMEL